MAAVNYNDVAANYDARYELHDYPGTGAAILRAIEGVERPRVLEVGCGTGHWLQLVKTRVRGCEDCDLRIANGSQDLRCGSVRRHTESGATIHLIDALPNVYVVISTGGSTVKEEKFDILYATREPNGPGCGTCTNASITVNVP